MTKQKIVALFSLCFCIMTANAQQGITVSGGNASGSGGSSSYSVGQIVYTTQGDSNGTVAQGVQLPFELSVRTGMDKQYIKLQLAAYPNPTTDFLILDLGNANLSALNFELYDVTGKVIEKRKIACETEKVYMDCLPAATYFLKVTDNNTEVKTFKIIKN